MVGRCVETAVFGVTLFTADRLMSDFGNGRLARLSESELWVDGGVATAEVYDSPTVYFRSFVLFSNL
jgi:hypothetical protein